MGGDRLWKEGHISSGLQEHGGLAKEGPVSTYRINIRLKCGMGQEKEVAHLNRKVREVGRSQATERSALYIRRLDFPPRDNGSHWGAI